MNFCSFFGDFYRAEVNRPGNHKNIEEWYWKKKKTTQLSKYNTFEDIEQQYYHIIKDSI